MMDFHFHDVMLSESERAGAEPVNQSFSCSEAEKVTWSPLEPGLSAPVCESFSLMKEFTKSQEFILYLRTILFSPVL